MINKNLSNTTKHDSKEQNAIDFNQLKKVDMIELFNTLILANNNIIDNLINHNEKITFLDTQVKELKDNYNQIQDSFNLYIESEITKNEIELMELQKKLDTENRELTVNGEGKQKLETIANDLIDLTFKRDRLRNEKQRGPIPGMPRTINIDKAIEDNKKEIQNKNTNLENIKNLLKKELEKNKNSLDIQSRILNIKLILAKLYISICKNEFIEKSFRIGKELINEFEEAIQRHIIVTNNYELVNRCENYLKILKELQDKADLEGFTENSINYRVKSIIARPFLLKNNEIEKSRHIIEMENEVEIVKDLFEKKIFNLNEENEEKIKIKRVEINTKLNQLKEFVKIAIDESILGDFSTFTLIKYLQEDIEGKFENFGNSVYKLFEKLIKEDLTTTCNIKLGIIVKLLQKIDLTADEITTLNILQVDTKKIAPVLKKATKIIDSDEFPKDKKLSLINIINHMNFWKDYNKKGLKDYVKDFVFSVCKFIINSFTGGIGGKIIDKITDNIFTKFFRYFGIDWDKKFPKISIDLIKNAVTATIPINNGVEINI